MLSAAIPASSAGLLEMPPELIVQCLEGLSIQDIVNTAQTCVLLRNIVLFNKKVLATAHNLYTVPLPRGTTLGKIHTANLFARAARSVIISCRLGSSQLDLNPLGDVTYDFSSTQAQWTGNIIDRDYPSRLFLCDDIVAFRLGPSVFVTKLGPSGVIGRSVRLEWHLDRGDEIEYQMSEDGRSIFLASAIVNGDDETGILSIREIRIADEDFGKTICRFEIGIPWFEMMSLALQGSYVALTTHEECFLVNWRDNVGICFSMRMSGTEGVEHDFRTEPYRCSFHPNDPVIFVFDDLCKSRISIIDVPDDMPRLTHKMSSLQEHWTPGNIQAREERAIMLPIPENLDCKVFQSGFRAISRSLIVLDLLVVAPEAQTFSFIDMFNLPRTIYTRHSVDTSCWTLQTEFTRFNTPALKTPEFRLMNTQIRPGVFFIMLLVGQTRTLIVPKFSEGYRNLYSWARIALPRYLAEKTRTDGREIMVPTCFDLRSGKLLAFLPDGLHVVQY